jgi:hypothetical protein
MRIRNIAAALPDFGLAWAFLRTWRYPYAFGDRAVRYFLYLVLLEFIVVHSTGFLGMVSIARIDRKKKVLLFTGLCGFYSVFALAFSHAYGNMWPLIAFWSLTLFKFPAVVFGTVPEKQKEAVVRQWGVMMGLYVMSALCVTFLPVPPWGVTDTVVKSQQFNASGIWVDEPQRVIAFGVIYFSLLGLFEFFGGRDKRASLRASKPSLSG